MTEVDYSLKLTDVETKIQDYLRVIETALGIVSPAKETTTTSQEGEAQTRVLIATKTELSVKLQQKIATLRSEALFRREEAKVIFFENQAAFAVNRARFLRTMYKQD